MKTILVTGSNGQLGNCIARLQNDFSQYKFLFADLPEIDITSKKSLQKLAAPPSPPEGGDVAGASSFPPSGGLKGAVDFIINCAAYTAVDKAENDEGLCRNVNVEGVRCLAEFAKKNNARLIHISTDYVFNGESFLPLTEETHTSPIGVYGITKLEGENAFRFSGASGVIIRTAWLYSEFGNNFVKTMLRLGKERGELSVIFDQVGTPTYAGDLAEIILKILPQIEKMEGVETYHFSNEGVASWYDFAKEIFDIAGLSVKVNPIETSQYPTPARRPHYSVLNKGKIKKDFSAEIPYWKESLRVCIERLKK